LGLYDTFSIPINVMRLFEANEVAPRESQMLSIFDTDRMDARDGITITSEIAAMDKAQGLDQGYEINDASDDPSPEKIEKDHVARFALLPIWPEQGMFVRYVISSTNPRARLRTRHTIEVDFLEVPAGSQSDTYVSACREVFVPIEGRTDLRWNGQIVDMERLDVLTVAPGVERSIQARGDGRTLMLRIRDTTNLQ
jgi:mannose-6-phosphate isomerase-like protein (cupin superfamily)